MRGVDLKHLAGRYERRGRMKRELHSWGKYHICIWHWLPSLFTFLSFYLLEMSILPLNRVNRGSDGERACLYKSYQRTVATFKTHSILENMHYCEILLHFSTRGYQDAGGTDGGKELLVKSTWICMCTSILSTTWHQKAQLYSIMWVDSRNIFDFQNGHILKMSRHTAGESIC